VLSLLGILGGVCFAWAAVPTALGCLSDGRNRATPTFIAWMILSGTVLLYAYLYLMYGFNWVLQVNYSVEAWSWGTILFYTYFPRKRKQDA
jgi:hypothetical protein